MIDRPLHFSTSVFLCASVANPPIAWLRFSDQRIASKFFCQVDEGCLSFQPARVCADIGQGARDVITEQIRRLAKSDTGVVAGAKTRGHKFKIADRITATLHFREE